MVKPVNPNKTPQPADQPPSKSPPPAYGKMTEKPMTFLGMHFDKEEAKQLWTAILQQVSSQIQQEQARALKALRKLKEKETEGNN